MVVQRFVIQFPYIGIKHEYFAQITIQVDIEKSNLLRMRRHLCYGCENGE